MSPAIRITRPRGKKNEEDVTCVEDEGSFIHVGWEEPES
jgi:hypothetical protein